MLSSWNKQISIIKEKGKMAQQLQPLAAKPDDLSLIPGTPASCPLIFTLYICTPTHMPKHTQ